MSYLAASKWNILKLFKSQKSGRFDYERENKKRSCVEYTASTIFEIRGECPVLTGFRQSQHFYIIRKSLLRRGGFPVGEAPLTRINDSSTYRPCHPCRPYRLALLEQRLFLLACQQQVLLLSEELKRLKKHSEELNGLLLLDQRYQLQTYL